MKIILLLLGGLFSITNLPAQISLDSTGYPISVIGTDSLKITAAVSVFPSLAATLNGVWDMSTIMDSTPVFFAYRVPSITCQFADSNRYNFGVFNYQGNVQLNIKSSGILEYGINIHKIGYSLFSLTSYPYDSFIINTQNMAYTQPRTKIAFPATNNTSWASAYQSDLGFKLTYLTYGDTLAPGIIRTYTTEKDSVIGWGKMRIQDATGSPSAYFEVLQVQTVITHTDSFFINDTTFSGILLTMFNVTQGQKDTIYEQNYYRVGEVTPLAQVEFRDAAFTQPYRATTHVQRLEQVAVADIANELNIKIYPNPVTNKTISIDLPQNTGRWSYQLTGIDGKTTKAEPLPTAACKGRITLPGAVIPGIYFLKLYNDGRQFCTKQIEIVK